MSCPGTWSGFPAAPSAWAPITTTQKKRPSIACVWILANPAPTLFGPPIVAKFLATFKEFPPSQRPSSFSIDQIVEKMERSFEGLQSN